MKIISRSVKDTHALAAVLAPFFKKGDVVLLLANLGAGKTTFVQGLVKKMGARDAALSPTFVIAQSLEGRLPIHHLDCYRLSVKEALDMGVADYLQGKGEIAPGLVLIEWAERIKKLWPPDRFEIEISIRPRSEEREFELTPRGRGFKKRFTALAEKLKKLNEKKN